MINSSQMVQTKESIADEDDTSTIVVIPLKLVRHMNVIFIQYDIITTISSCITRYLTCKIWTFVFCIGKAEDSTVPVVTKVVFFNRVC
jgi:hypothetical protein